MFLNGTCFNGLYRVNKLGEFNAAWGHRNRWSFDRDNIFQISSVIKNTEIFHGDYRKSGGFITRDTFVYLDPPYDGSYDKYTSEGFDSQELKRFFTHCVDKGAYCVLSNSSHIRNYKRYGEYKIIPVNTRWAINSSAQTNKSSSEILVVGNATRKTHRK
jgi:DNA adenine methylase